MSYRGGSTSQAVQHMRWRLQEIGPALQAQVARGTLTLEQAERRKRTTIVEVRPGVWVGRIRPAMPVPILQPRRRRRKPA